MPPDPDLPPAARRKLAGVLGMLGSDHAGERDAAAQLANKIVRAAGMTWDQVIAAPRLEPPHSPRGSPPPRPPPGWRALANRCAAYSEWLNEWEQRFLAGLPARTMDLSAKQHACLDKIADKLRSQGFAP